MLLTIVISTRQPVANLLATLAAVDCARRHARCSTEVIVADNSQFGFLPDEQQTVEERWGVRVLRVPEPGQSGALNRAVRQSVGDWIVLTDDDVEPGHGWIESYRIAIERHPECGYLIGPILPRYERTPEPWYRAVAPPSHAGRNLGSEELRLVLGCREYDLIGANSALRADLCRRFRFDERLGPGSRWTMTGADTKLGRQILGAGFDARYVPGATVTHRVGVRRLSLSYLAGRKRSVGRASVTYPGATAEPILIETGRVAAGAARVAHRLLVNDREWRRELLELVRLWGSCEGRLLFRRTWSIYGT